MMQKITPFLWFDSQAEEAAKFYTSIFRDSKMCRVTRYLSEGQEIHGREPGSVMVAEFQIEGQAFTALNGGPLFKFNESISFVVHCESQEEVDHYWNQLSAGGDPKAQQCGWLKDKFGVSWQIIPNILLKMLADDDREKANRVMRAMLGMNKIDIAELERAYRG
jgi:predicted 3-demethylubiquinone-9 3-methyltransferase (glyoxalase superfamily)